jgi:hypothetical protein
MPGGGVAQSPARLVGRDDELSMLRDALGRALAGEAAVVVVRGEAGIGKPGWRQRRWAASMHRGG